MLRLGACVLRAAACLPGCPDLPLLPRRVLPSQASAFMPPTSQVSEEPPVDDPDLSIRCMAA